VRLGSGAVDGEAHLEAVPEREFVYDSLRGWVLRLDAEGFVE
jgi:hypothetical protein